MLDSVNFTMKIQRFAIEHNVSMIDAICDYCEKNNIEIETAAHLIAKNKSFKELLELEAKQNRMLKDNKMFATLPI